ncbi:MAG: S66 peptidase family protein [Candidatus Dojkabacteria bacterium]|jgi:muramoyltetrapeptide carboxypeptidase|nr:LD-carboxypeptidase [Candidatus Dojkabacteria bacterium]
MIKDIKIGVFATSTPLDRPRHKDDYRYLKAKGLSISEHPQVRKVQGHTAGNISERVVAIEDFLKDDSIDILMSYWGGANTNQLLPYLNYNLFKKYPKPIIGFSDTTALLLAVNKLSGIKTYMGPAGITFDKPEPFQYTYKYFEKILIKGEKNFLIEDSEFFADDLYYLRKDSDHRILQKNKGRKIYKNGKADGEIVAANLQTLLVLQGTKFYPDLKDKVLFIEEDEGSSVAMIHRFLTQLSQSMDLNKLKAILIGRFASQSGFNKESTEEAIYDDVFKNVNIPIIYNLDFGHTDPLFTIPIGGKAIIDTEKGRIEIKL